MDKKSSSFSRRMDIFQKEKDIDYKNVKALQRYVSEKGKISASRVTNLSAKKQRALALAIKRARFLGLMSYVGR